MPVFCPCNRLARCEALRVEVDAQKKSVASAEEKLREQQAKGGAGAPAAEAKVAVEKDKESSEWRGWRGGKLRRSCVSVRLSSVSIPKRPPLLPLFNQSPLLSVSPRTSHTPHTMCVLFQTLRTMQSIPGC